MGTRTASGYIRKGFLTTVTELAILRRQIVACAESNGVEVDAIYEEELDRNSVELVACIDALLDADEAYLIVPSLLHFAGFNNPLEVRRDLESRGIRVLTVRDNSQRPENRTGEE
ncbi:hypothetical protein OG474_38630 [Kribbella sp. NBC_01505]|uniref:hypothetical protein n=1 Tax=Kribbella sp. NBC_01505 TaxID=2903580 RepID=UPI00386786C4